MIAKVRLSMVEGERYGRLVWRNRSAPGSPHPSWLVPKLLRVHGFDLRRGERFDAMHYFFLV